MSDKHFIVLTIGPVQSYISQARRTHDLFQGSRILSYLTSAGVNYAQQQDESAVIYPAIQAGFTDNIPNRIVVAWSGSAEDATKIAEGMEDAIRSKFDQLAHDVKSYFLDWVADGSAKAAVHEIWQAQQDTWLECYWVVVPGTGAYGDDIRHANQVMGARKMLRNFPHIQEAGRKDSITGEHAVLHDGNDDAAFWHEIRDRQRNLALLGSTERLSAISVIKRFAHEPKVGHEALEVKHRYPSTSSIAAASFKYDVLSKLGKSGELVDKLQGFLQSLEAVFENNGLHYFRKEGQHNPEYFPYIEKCVNIPSNISRLATQFQSIDGDFLFEDTLITKTIEEYSGRRPTSNDRPTSNEMTCLQNALRLFVHEARKLDIPPPQPYLAILSMDGDHMGKTLGTLNNEGEHSNFSKILAKFARDEVPDIVQAQYLGRLVYAGGDDVLALVSVRHVLQVADKLRQDFAEAVKKYKNHKGEAITASVGIAVVHHTHDLQSAVRAAKSAEKDIAKTQWGRKAIGIKLLRRSGEPREMGSKWEIEGEALIPHITKLQELFRTGTLSRNLPQDLGRIAYEMDGSRLPREAVLAEIGRVVKRRMTETASESDKKAAVEVMQWLATHTPNLHDVQNWITLARFIAQKEGTR